MDELARRARRAPNNHSHYGGVEDPRRKPPKLGPTPAGHLPRPSNTHPPAQPGSRRGSGPHAAPRSKPHQGTHATTHTRTPSLASEHAVIQAFDSVSYTATVQLVRSPDVTVSGVPVSRGIPANALTPGRTAAVLFFDHHNPADAMVVGVY